MGLFESLVDMVGQVLSGVFGDVWRLLSGWAAEHPLTAAGAVGVWVWLGRMKRVASLLPRDLAAFALLLGPPLLIWGLCRRTKSGRRGFAVALPVVAGGLLVGMWWYAPGFRRGAVISAALLAAAALATWFDVWTEGRGWSAASVKAALARDDAREAFRAGVQAAAPGARVGRATVSGGQVSVPVRTETPGALALGVADGKVGATASARGVPVSDVMVAARAADAQGQVTVRGTVAGQPHPLDGKFDYPDGGSR